MTTKVRKTRRADELKPGDWLVFNENGDYEPNEVMAAFQYPTARGLCVHLTTQVPGRSPYSATAMTPEALFELVAEEELTELREQAERAQKIADLRQAVDFLDQRPWLPLPDIHVHAHLHDIDGYRLVRELAEREGVEPDTSLADRTVLNLRTGALYYTAIAWHTNGRPAESKPITQADIDAAKFAGGWTSAAAQAYDDEDDPTGLAYSRADDEPDDPTPVSPDRVPMHNGAMTEAGLVDETPAEAPAFDEECWHGNTCPGTGPDCGRASEAF